MRDETARAGGEDDPCLGEDGGELLAIRRVRRGVRRNHGSVAARNHASDISLRSLRSALDFTTGLRSRLSAIYSTLNTFGIHIPENCLQLENVDSLLKVAVFPCGDVVPGESGDGAGEDSSHPEAEPARAGAHRQRPFCPGPIWTFVSCFFGINVMDGYNDW